MTYLVGEVILEHNGSQPNMDGVLMRWRVLEADMGTGRIQCESEGRDKGDMSASQGHHRV